ncbi:2-dehydropantoate 2-reductase (Ketopantoate reductase) (KPA reductase) (KPR) [Pleurotus ostreatus]|uniref:2-dehydropantoate 2-reductase n=3 Tax=Pleurotus TaxID=5320 RepID=A0A067NVP9_PLEO1|nr:2-dehydropantoate 2-reductase (Ketopantoate reductase) (KPA reductase) (KPR) [Pleurotus ostreatus]KAF7436518.1 2-dehydropantoate 2-reductase (Ketopantoate reductase) (KPA reductase) (KPR) [Pleurotus ostreatus]KAG9222521.1 hypothetical protein CCMSSC00406_0002856 [Pleurotus cornucopiae]KAJ8702245.1 2-dehydropantoate 2-reductase (Ketopantoate reductase) (KPA reductase) (KPR) [Pleurotus ostreatus]KDQ31085.1 hypothetical protein PLEOSDRAFT_1075267 [Pleurotus ostreatus PC15]
MHFHILGIGPIGSLIAYHLRRALPPNHAVSLIHKNLRQSRESISSGGSVSVERDGHVSTAVGFRHEVFEQPYIQAQTQNEDPKSTESPSSSLYESDEFIESLIVTTKAHQTVPAIRRLLPRISRDSTIVLLQNGMGVYEKLASEIFLNARLRPHFVLASNTHGAFFKSMQKVVHTGVGAIDFGIVPDINGRDYEAGFANGNKPHPHDIIQAQEDPAFPHYRTLRNTVAALLMLKSLNTSWKPMADIQVAMRRKLAVNAVINPLTALMNCRNGDLFKTEASLRIMQRVCQEATDAYTAQLRAEAEDYLSKQASQGADTQNISVGTFPRGLTRSALQAECLRVAEVTKGNISSMLHDVRRGRRTEIEFLNGYLVGLGGKHRVEMPANIMLMNLIKMRSAIPIDQILP